MWNRWATAIWLAVWWLWIPVVLLLTWLFTATVTKGIGDWRRDLEVYVFKGWLLPDGLNIFNATGLFWIMMIIGIIGSALIIYRDGNGGWTPGVALAILLVVSMVFTINAFWDNDKDEARFYNTATT